MVKKGGGPGHHSVGLPVPGAAAGGWVPVVELGPCAAGDWVLCSDPAGIVDGSDSNMAHADGAEENMGD